MAATLAPTGGRAAFRPPLTPPYAAPFGAPSPFGAYSPAPYAVRPAAPNGRRGWRAPRAQLRLGRLWVDVVTRQAALDALAALVAEGAGGAVYTPNVDHVVMAQRDAAFEAAYAAADLCLADGVPLVWASRLLRPRFPEKLSGSDLLVPMARLAAERGWGVYLLGGGPGAAEGAARRMRDELGVRVVGVDDAMVSRHPDPASDAAVITRIRRARPDLVFVALGAPKQELFIARARPHLGAAVCVGVGASLDFMAGTLRRSPAWMSRAGLEWLYRLGQEPRRLWRRYLVQDPAFALVVLRAFLSPRAERVRWADA